MPLCGRQYPDPSGPLHSGWGKVNTPAHLVVIKGTEYFDAPSMFDKRLPHTTIVHCCTRRTSSLMDVDAWASFISADSLLLKFADLPQFVSDPCRHADSTQTCPSQCTIKISDDPQSKRRGSVTLCTLKKMKHTSAPEDGPSCLQEHPAGSFLVLRAGTGAA